MADKDDDEKSAGNAQFSDDDSPAPRREQIPDAVDHFLGQLLQSLQKQEVNELHKLYEEKFNELSTKYYGGKSPKAWPSFANVAEQVSAEPLFLIFYKELYYRHIYSHPGTDPKKPLLTFEHRKGSWENYSKLLELVIDDLEQGEEPSIALPSQWAWDLLDEFVYHYQNYSQFRNKIVKMHMGSESKTVKQQELMGKDIEHLQENPDVFKTTSVLGYLHRLVNASLIREYLTDPSNAAGHKGGAFANNFVMQLGYFALMQLMRMHSLLGDYYTAMKTIECLDFNAEVPFYYKIPACHVTLYYYMGFSYLMMRRYVDAIRTFSDILVFLSKTSGVNNLSYQFDQILKKQQQMYTLLLMCVALCPQPLDESLEKHIQNDEKLRAKQAQLQRGEEACFEENFSYACPKFVSGALPCSLESGESFGIHEAHERQKNLFLKEVQQQTFLPKISSYMKLYTAIKTSKLAQLCDMDEEGLRDQLMCVMHKTHQCIRKDGAPLNGELKPCSEVEFYLDGSMVHINAHKTERPHADVFLEHILKYQDLLRKMGMA